MPLEHRDPVSKAKLFIPTNRERSLVLDQRRLKESLSDVDKLKAELQELLNKAKGEE
ncbi:hypothetical protein CPT_Mater146 [Bacillus phage Mater]|uniref:Uncharacterized protein n=1 Tax=Bacillus phage Mater TaxID=1540090 RepID=A0A0A0RUQ3_9CAUD|nr:hypothetical protein CPT_Mater146 [Bacillus phage Mater]AIW03303.1 hypothetical protein CPT_Mater146 [Bacillus phage Mater]